MNKLDGRVAVGLDEFMLRVGHLKVLAILAGQSAGNRMRLARSLAARLTEERAIPSAMEEAIAEYLRRKRLSVVVQPDGAREEPPQRSRYRHLEVQLSSGGGVARVTATAGDRGLIWFQDLCIADPRTRSKVGAVTVETREITNKSGVSHLVDWGVILGLLNRRLGPTALGRALVGFDGATAGTDSNPYVIGAERLLIGWALIQADGDVIARLLAELAAVSELRKQDAVALMLKVQEGLRAAVGRGEKATSYRVASTIRSLGDDLGIERSGRGRSGPSESTVWHRVSSRLETLVDLGFLEKLDAAGNPRQYDYWYRPSPSLKAAVSTASNDIGPAAWASEHLAEAIAGKTLVNEPCADEMRQAIRMALGPTGLHIETFAVLASALALARDKHLSIAGARSRLVDLAARHPRIVSLSRGYTGEGAEFASVDLKAVESIEFGELWAAS